MPTDNQLIKELITTLFGSDYILTEIEDLAEEEHEAVTLVVNNGRSRNID